MFTPFYFDIKSLSNKQLDTDEDLKKSFKSKVITEDQFNEAKKAGYGAIGEQGIADKLLELGIMTVISKDW